MVLTHLQVSEYLNLKLFLAHSPGLAISYSHCPQYSPLIA